MLKNVTHLFYVSNDNDLTRVKIFFKQKGYDTLLIDTLYCKLKKQIHHNAKLIIMGYYDKESNIYFVEPTYLARINKLELAESAPLTKDYQVEFPYDIPF